MVFGAKIQQATGPHEDLLTIIKRRKLQWYGHVSRSLGLTKTILQGTVKGGRRQGRHRKRREDNIREWTGVEFGKSQCTGEQGKMEKTGCKIICGTPMTLADKELMMMMMFGLDRMCSQFVLDRVCSLFGLDKVCSLFELDRVCSLFGLDRVCSLFGLDSVCSLCGLDRVCSLFGLERVS